METHSTISSLFSTSKNKDVEFYDINNTIKSDVSDSNSHISNLTKKNANKPLKLLKKPSIDLSFPDNPEIFP